METVTMDNYNPHLLIVLKQLINPESGDVQYQMYKTTELETVLHDARTRTESIEKQLTKSNGQIGQILGNLNTQGWYNPNVDKEDVLRDLCEILDHEAKQDITITATVQVEVTYACPLDEVEDFDARYFLQDNLTIDSWHGDVVIDSFDVEDADVNW